jgi:hypothetical protein
MAYVIIDVLFWHSASGDDVVIVTVIQKQDASGFHHRPEVIQGDLLLVILTLEVWQMSEGIPQAHDAVEALRRDFRYIFKVILQGQPICFFNNCRAINS